MTIVPHIPPNERPVARAGRPPMAESLAETIEGEMYGLNRLVRVDYAGHRTDRLEHDAEHDRWLGVALACLDAEDSRGARAALVAAQHADEREDAAAHLGDRVVGLDIRQLGRRVCTWIEALTTGRCRGREIAPRPTTTEQMPLEGMP